MSAPSSDTIRQLAAKAQVLGLPQQPNISQSSRQLLQQADQERRLLSSSEIQSLCQHSGVMAAPLEQLQGQAQPLVDQARHDLLEAQPHLVKPGERSTQSIALKPAGVTASISCASAATPSPWPSPSSPIPKAWKPLASCMPPWVYPSMGSC